MAMQPGCTTGTTTTVETPVTSMLTGTGASGAVDQLDFFDALEGRSNVTWDELLAGVLLAAGRRADGTYADRLGAARRAAIVGTEAPANAEAIATPGDLAKVMLRAQGLQLRQTLSDEEALAIASRRSLVPATLTAGDPLTGSVAVSALSAAGRPTAPSRRTTHINNRAAMPAGGSNP
ncbi:MAG TPA: hypothetical protein VFF65_04725 [Phycisphaerales bacterium]|nr:hypothetical protein [Phycisphaerales bacterium]